jgi:hypothetical protein
MPFGRYSQCMNRELLVVDSLLPMLEEGMWQGDLDVGEMFYNYLLDPAIQQFCGVDIDPYLGNKASPARMSWLLWRQCVMGLNTYPHGCIQMHSLAEEFLHGQWMDVNNPFYYESIALNFPGPLSYNPSKPWLCKFNTVAGAVANDMLTYRRGQNN